MMAFETVSARALAVLFVNALNLEDVDPYIIDCQSPLFGGELDLDSLDMLEISLVVQQHFGIKLRGDDPHLESILGSIQSLADYINTSLARTA